MTKLNKNADKGKFPPLEKYLDTYGKKEIQIFSNLFQHFTPLELYQTLQLFETYIPIRQGGQIIEDVWFMTSNLKDDFISIHSIIKGLDFPTKASLEGLVSSLADYSSPLDAYRRLDYLLKLALYEFHSYAYLDGQGKSIKKYYDAIFELKKAYFQIAALENNWDISKYLEED